MPSTTSRSFRTILSISKAKTPFKPLPRPPHLYLLILALLPLFACAKQLDKKVCIKNTCFSAEVAETPQARAYGLMLRKSLGEREGMLFIYEQPGKLGFWMKNMQIPLDILWIDSRRQIVDIAKNVSPCKEECPTMEPQKEAQYVLEIKAGSVDSYAIEIGDAVSF